MQDLSILSNEALLEGLRRIACSHRQVTAEFVRHLAEVDVRRLAVQKGFPSLFGYAVEQLGLSEDEACRRIEAARLVRRFPLACRLLETGALTLTVLCLLKPHLTEGNHRELLEEVRGASVRAAKERIAARFPQADVPSSIRKLPARSVAARPTAAVAEGPRGAPAAARVDGVEEPALGGAPAAARVDGVEESALGGAPAAARVDGVEPALGGAPAAAREDGVEEPPLGGAPAAARVTGPASAAARVEPLSGERFLVKVTASRALRDKLEAARDLMRHVNPEGALDVVLERAVDLLLVELAKKRQGRVERPREVARSTKRTYVSRAVRRKVVERDGWCCSFVAEDGRRCGARSFLEFDHREPKGLGGGSGADNLRLRCKAHNRVEAERAYGEAHISRAISESRRRDERRRESTGTA